MTTSQFEPHIISFCCHNCISSADDTLNLVSECHSLKINLVKMPCTGKIEILYLLKAFEEGADGVLVVGCPEGECHYLEGNIRTKRKVQFTKKILNEIGVGGHRIQMYHLDPSKPDHLLEVTKEMIKTVSQLGPSPLKKATS